jgi:DNA repair protein RadA/Sms
LALKSQQHTPSVIFEVDRVLGPGITKGGVYLLAGQPGIGKSTLLTQIAIKSSQSVLYVCSEENPAQVATRINRLSNTKTDHIQLLNTTIVENIISAIHDLQSKNYDLVIVDYQISFTATTAGSPARFMIASPT